MKNITPEETPQSAKTEGPYTTEYNKSKYLIWLREQNWFLWGGITGILIALYRNYNRIIGWFS